MLPDNLLCACPEPGNGNHAWRIEWFDLKQVVYNCVDLLEMYSRSPSVIAEELPVQIEGCPAYFPEWVIEGSCYGITIKFMVAIGIGALFTLIDASSGGFALQKGSHYFLSNIHTFFFIFVFFAAEYCEIAQCGAKRVATQKAQ